MQKQGHTAYDPPHVRSDTWFHCVHTIGDQKLPFDILDYLPGKYAAQVRRPRTSFLANHPGVPATKLAPRIMVRCCFRRYAV
jgi:hypothetical protein